MVIDLPVKVCDLRVGRLTRIRRCKIIMELDKTVKA